jgi:hypothetical protein
MATTRATERMVKSLRFIRKPVRSGYAASFAFLPYQAIALPK